MRQKIQLYFIFTVVELHGGAIMPLVDVFVDVLDCLDRRNALDIDVTVVQLWTSKVIKFGIS
jgi:hypothetical protein